MENTTFSKPLSLTRCRVKFGFKTEKLHSYVLKILFMLLQLINDTRPCGLVTVRNILYQCMECGQ